MGRRCKTPSFITEIPLEVNPAQEKILLKRLDAGRRVYNACLGETLNRLQKMRDSDAYQAARAMPPGQGRSKAFAEVRQHFEFGEYKLHAYAKQFGYSWLGDHLDANTVQKIATRAYNAVNEYALGKKGKPAKKHLVGWVLTPSQGLSLFVVDF